MSFRLRRRSAVGGVAVGATALITVGATLAAAQEPGEEPISISPTSGPPGTTIAVSGGGCDGIEVGLVLYEDEEPLDTAEAEPDDDGNWTGTLTVPSEGFEEDTELAVDASCIGGLVSYSDAFFTVDVEEEPEPTSSTTTTATTAPTTSTTQPQPGSPGDGGPKNPPSPTTSATVRPAPVGAPVAPAAPPAAPVTARPSFTG